MTVVVESGNAVSHWQALVSEAEQQIGLQLAEEVESYLVFTLMRYLNNPAMANRIMALDYLQAAQHAGTARSEQFRDVGDQCLLYAGLFPQQAQRRRVRISYYIDIGRSAYYQLGESQQHLAGTFMRLCEEFVAATDTLQAIGKMRDSEHLRPIEAFDYWQDTGSPVARENLKQWSDASPVAGSVEAKINKKQVH